MPFVTNITAGDDARRIFVDGVALSPGESIFRSEFRRAVPEGIHVGAAPPTREPPPMPPPPPPLVTVEFVEVVAPEEKIEVEAPAPTKKPVPKTKAKVPAKKSRKPGASSKVVANKA